MLRPFLLCHFPSEEIARSVARSTVLIKHVYKVNSVGGTEEDCVKNSKVRPTVLNVCSSCSSIDALRIILRIIISSLTQTSFPRTSSSAALRPIRLHLESNLRHLRVQIPQILTIHHNAQIHRPPQTPRPSPHERPHPHHGHHPRIPRRYLRSTSIP